MARGLGGGNTIRLLALGLLEIILGIVQATLQAGAVLTRRRLARLRGIKRRLEPLVGLGIGVLHLLKLLFQGVDLLLEAILLLHGGGARLCGGIATGGLVGYDLRVVPLDLATMRELRLLVCDGIVEGLELVACLGMRLARAAHLVHRRGTRRKRRADRLHGRRPHLVGGNLVRFPSDGLHGSEVAGIDGLQSLLERLVFRRLLVHVFCHGTLPQRA